MFETALVASRNATPFRNPKLLPIALLVHGIALAGAVSANYWSVEAVQEPDIVNMIPLLLSPPLPEMPVNTPPAPPSPPPPAPPPDQPATQPPPIDVPPTTIDDLPPVSDAPEQPTTYTGPVIPGALPGDGPPCVNCSGPGGDGDANTPVHVFAGMVPPEVITRVMPKYTEAARRARVEGIVILEATIGADGVVRAARVTKSLPMGLDHEAVAAVERWKFRPASYAGQARAVYFTLTVRFALQ